MIIHEVIFHLIFDFRMLAVCWPISGDRQVAGLKETEVHVLTSSNLGLTGPVAKVFAGFCFFCSSRKVWEKLIHYSGIRSHDRNLVTWDNIHFIPMVL